MRWCCLRALCIGFVLLTLSACDRGRGAPSPSKGLDHETMVAYQELGGVYGEWCKEGNVMPGVHFSVPFRKRNCHRSRSCSFWTP